MNLFVPIILIGILLIVTILLALADYLLGGQGEKTLTVNDKTKITVQGEDTLLNTLSVNNIFIPSACGGKATCGYCKCKVVKGAGGIKPTEEPFLSEEEKEDGVRLSCQVKVKENMEILIPEELLSAKEYKATVTKITSLTYDIKLVSFKLVEPEEMFFRPGQYAQLRVPGVEVIRAYSIASNPKMTNTLEFIIRLVPKGQATTFVHMALEVGDTITITGPYGDFYLNEESDEDIICIAGGSGKAPIRAILYYLKDKGMNRKVKYFFGAKTKKDLYYTEELLELAKEYPNFQYIPALSEPSPEDNWEGEVGLITDVVDRHSENLEDSEAYLCGSPGMIDACIRILTKKNIHMDNVHYDKF
ncbi:NADH:ubiquinone reductase (Na(+)-transporting) subunit F [Cellulosilyticum sp. I15G10I2]|uniref:NADH:ubiquinone reductase (Na(+)-transporting) subunit F n=1 Tax=Cellulosilyticum sp. I15G10I2 TaxID=1892843 RepID=UPI00085BE044|nr:2Fe-2S iron-sulfur cluster binding domain-containing protein [Cellulosilyticum sp. I15G10I2]